MNDPIISPFIIYLMGVLPFIKIVILVLCGVIFLPLLTELSGCNSKEERERVIKSIKIFAILGCIALLIPSKETMIQMAVANQITHERVDIAKDVAIKVYNDILNVMQK